MSKETVTILWTGGWDSTYRIVELSMRDVLIQPVYVEDEGRKSVPYERKAMKEVVKLLESKPATKATFLPVKVVKLTDIPEDPEITKAYMLFKEEADMGSQHDWLARLALQFPGMELCIEKALGEHAPCRQSINRHGKLIDTGDGYILDKENSSKELNLILGNLKLPIFDKTEKDMKRDIRKWGYKDVMSHIWFCHTPIHDKPCGLCSPCTTKMTSDMAFLLPKAARKRNIRMRAIEKRFGKKAASYYKRIVRKFSR
ncbi:MAG: hypothetical protein Q4A32_01330 [Lachnospiraceae bacterium]|nr:hypothetical protein [Lachnospiraceae bacterium]